MMFRPDLLDLCKVKDAQFWPMWRQEIARDASGRSQGKDLGPPIWRASFTTTPAHHYEAAPFEAAILSLGGVLGSFLAHDIRRPYPAAHREGAFDDTAVIEEVFVDNAFTLRLSGLAPGFTLSPGDYLGFSWGARPYRALHMISVGGVFDGAGVSPVLRVEPHLPPGVAQGLSVTLKRPPCEMRLEPDTAPPVISDLLTSSLTFSAVEV